MKGVPLLMRPRQPGDTIVVRIRDGGRGRWIPATIKAVHEDRSVTVCASKYTRLGYPDHFMPTDVRTKPGRVRSSARRY